MKNVIGITIGPILKTILSAIDTGQLWGSSYIFSYLMKNIIIEFDKKGLISERIIPAKINEGSVCGVGIYPDRLIFINEGLKQNNIKNIIEESIDYVLLSMIARQFEDDDSLKIYKFLKEYFQIHYVIKNIDEINNIVLDINEILDSLELNYQIMPKEINNLLMSELKNKSIKEGFLFKDAGIEGSKIPSIPEITQKYNKNAKYYAIVQSDGDNIGKIIKNIGNDVKKIKAFSESLNSYIKNAKDVLDDYKAFTIYAGGDDLLFLAPLKTSNGKTIYDLLDELNEKFKSEFPNDKVSLSFGLCITYMKYPLYESLNLATNLLFGDAKNFEIEGKKKNAVATQIVKHSGQSSKIIFNQDSKSYRKFKDMLEEKINDNSIDLKSIKNNFRNGNTVLKSVLQENLSIEPYFENNYNELIHNKYENYIYKIIKLVESYMNENKKEVSQVLIDIYNIIEIRDFVLKGGPDEGRS